MNEVIEVIEEMDFDLSEPSDNVQVVYAARQVLEQMGFDESRQFLIAAAVSELATNIVRYAGEGKIFLRIIRRGEKKGFEVAALDYGPGMEDIEKAFSDNYSTGKGLGLGLPSVKRIMDETDIRSVPGDGTLIVAKIWMKHV